MARIASKKTLNLIDTDGTTSDVLSDEMRKSFNIAKDHKSSSGITQRLYDNLQQFTSQYPDDVACKLAEAGEPDIFFPLGALKARAQYSWIRDVVAGAMNKMWVGEPSAIVDLPPDSREKVRESIMADMEEIDNLAVVDFGVIEDFVANAVDEELDRLYEEAQDKIDRMSRVIVDQWQEGGWLDAWSEATSDLGIYPVCITKGPVQVKQVVGKWSSSGKFIQTTEVKPIMYRVAPENWYPMPDVGHDVNSGTGVFEMGTMTRSELQQASSDKIYNMDAIKRVLEENPDGWTEGDSDWMKVEHLINRSDGASSENELGWGVYHTIKYYGRMNIGFLREHVKSIPKSVKDDEYYEVETWMIGDEVIYAVLSPYPLQQRPFSVVPRQFVAGSAWGGDSLQDMIKSIQRIVNALVRQHIINMGFAAQPIGEVEASRVPGGKPPDQIRAGRIYPVLSSIHGEKAYRFTELQSKSAEYLNAMDYYFGKADELSGIPGYIIGSPGAESQSTLGQTNFYYSNASKGIGALLSLVDRFLVKPMLDRYYIRNMIVIDDDSIKGDINWQPKGLAGIFEQQIKQDQSAQVLQMMTQLREVMPSYITEESFLEVVGPLFKSIGLDIDDVLKQNTKPTAQPNLPPIGPDGQPLPPELAAQQAPLPVPVTPDQISQNLNQASSPVPVTTPPES